MFRNNEFLLNSLLNSLWIIPMVWGIAALGAYLLRNLDADYRYTIWLAALVLCVIAPLLSSTQILSIPPLSFKSTPLPSSSALPTNYQTTTTNDGGDTPLTNVRERNRPIVKASSEKVQMLTIAYLLFILFAVFRLARLWWRKEKLRKSATSSGLTAQIESVATHCSNLFHIRHVGVARSSLAGVPCTLGVRRPLIVLPDSFCRYISDNTLLSVIAHEMAHVSRRDYLTKLLVEFISLPISFHPITFLIKRQLDREREVASDELVTKRAMMPDVYARSLLSAAGLSLLPTRQVITLSIFDGGNLEKRIMRLANKKVSMSRNKGRMILTTVLFVLCMAAVSLSAFGVELRADLAGNLSLLKTAVASEPAVFTFTKPPVPELDTKPPAPQQLDTKPPVPQQLESGLSAVDPQEQAQAACTSGRKRDLEAIPRLISMLGDETRIQPLRCWGTGHWSPALQSFKAPSLGEEAAIALASMGRDAYPQLLNQLDSPFAVVRRNAAWAIGELTDMLPNERATAVPQLISLLSDRDAWVRMAAARAVGELRDDRASDALITTLSDSDWRVRQMVTWALSELKEPGAVSALCIVLLSDVRSEVRRGAAEALGEIASKEALASLKQALNDPETNVSTKVKWAIAEIEGSDG